VLGDAVRTYVAGAGRARTTPKALIAPHAGFVYSGPVAGAAYAQLETVKKRVSRVVLLGPSHRVAFRGVALSGADAFRTPLGLIPVDADNRDRVMDLEQVSVLEAAHTEEHSLEVQLPFLQQILGVFRFLPLVVGDAPPAAVHEVLDRVWGGDETLIVISSDLSHYHDYDSAVRLDRETTHAIESIRVGLRPDQACGCRAVNGLLHAAADHSMRVTTLSLKNSGDTAGSRDRVVGYGAYAFE